MIFQAGCGGVWLVWSQEWTLQHCFASLQKLILSQVVPCGYTQSHEEQYMHFDLVRTWRWWRECVFYCPLYTWVMQCHTYRQVHVCCTLIERFLVCMGESSPKFALTSESTSTFPLSKRLLCIQSLNTLTLLTRNVLCDAGQREHLACWLITLKAPRGHNDHNIQDKVQLFWSAVTPPQQGSNWTS